MLGEKKKVGVGFGVMILRDGKLLLGQRHIDPEKADSELHGEGTWTMPGGKLEFGETFLEWAARELLEETGMVGKTFRLCSLSDDIIPDVHFVTAGFLCEDAEGEPQVMEPDEITRWGWFSLDALPSPLFMPSRKVLDNYLASRIYYS